MSTTIIGEQRSFLGTGWGFPPAFSKHPVCTVRTVSEEDDINESLHILLVTRPGDRVMRPDYGCNLEFLLFDPMNDNLITYIKDMLSRAILYYEPRIEMEDITILMSEAMQGQMLVELEYVIRSTNSRFNMVYDYYKKELTVTPLS